MSYNLRTRLANFIEVRSKVWFGLSSMSYHRIFMFSGFTKKLMFAIVLLQTMFASIRNLDIRKLSHPRDVAFRQLFKDVGKSS
jgi:hypothetical protein